MKARFQRTASERGFTLIWVLAILMILSVLFGEGFTQLSHYIRGQQQEMLREQAFQLAESGVEIALAQMRTGKLQPGRWRAGQTGWIEVALPAANSQIAQCFGEVADNRGDAVKEAVLIQLEQADSGPRIVSWRRGLYQAKDMAPSAQNLAQKTVKRAAAPAGAKNAAQPERRPAEAAGSSNWLFIAGLIVVVIVPMSLLGLLVRRLFPFGR